jgi:hypothetical protein
VEISVQKYGLHPFVALGVICVDIMLFYTDLLIVTWPISVLFGILLMIPSIILQRYAYEDSWLLALAKGMLIGILTAIPTPLPAIITGAGGTIGVFETIKKYIGKHEETSDTKLISDNHPVDSFKDK